MSLLQEAPRESAWEWPGNSWRGATMSWCRVVGQAAVDAAVPRTRQSSAGQGNRLRGRCCENCGRSRALGSRIADFGRVDIWINNAGMTNRKLNLDQVPDEQIEAVVQTNVLGLMNCCKVVIAGMLTQGSGKIFNMEGFGSDGLTKPGMSVYGATKSALHYFTKSLVKEYKDTPLIICYMSPGIVVTDLLTKDLNDANSEEFQKRKGLMNIVADRVETVAPYLVDGALNANKTGAAVRWMSVWQLTGSLHQIALRQTRCLQRSRVGLSTQGT